MFNLIKDRYQDTLKGDLTLQKLCLIIKDITKNSKKISALDLIFHNEYITLADNEEQKLYRTIFKVISGLVLENEYYKQVRDSDYQLDLDDEISIPLKNINIALSYIANNYEDIETTRTKKYFCSRKDHYIDFVSQSLLGHIGMSNDPHTNIFYYYTSKDSKIFVDKNGTTLLSKLTTISKNYGFDNHISDEELIKSIKDLIISFGCTGDVRIFKFK